MKYTPMATGRREIHPDGNGAASEGRRAERGSRGHGRGRLPPASILAPPPCAASRGGAGGLSNSSSAPQLQCSLFILSPLCPELPFTLSNSLAITFLSRQAEI